MAKDIIKNIPLTLDINAKKRIEGKVGISLYSKDIATGQFEFTFIDEDGDPVELDETYSAQTLVKYEDEEKTYLDDMIIEGNIIRFIFPHDFITKDGIVTMYIYITKDSYTSDVAAISFNVYRSEIDDVATDIVAAYDKNYEDILAEFKQTLEDYKSTLPKADSVRAEIDEVLNKFSEDSQAKLSQYDTDVQQVITDINEAETSRVEAEGQRESAETSRKANEADRDQAESERQTNETKRQTTFETNESERDGTFNTNETTRQENETIRQQAEAQRVLAENERNEKYGSYAQQFNDVITDLSEEKDYHSLPEISGARGGHETLGQRLDETTAQLAQTEYEIARKPDRDETGWGTFNTFDEPTRATLQGLAPGTINAVLGDRNVQYSNIANNAVSFRGLNPKLLENKTTYECYSKSNLEISVDFVFDLQSALSNNLVTSSDDVRVAFDLYTEDINVSQIGGKVWFNNSPNAADVWGPDRDFTLNNAAPYLASNQRDFVSYSSVKGKMPTLTHRYAHVMVQVKQVDVAKWCRFMVNNVSITIGDITFSEVGSVADLSGAVAGKYVLTTPVFDKSLLNYKNLDTKLSDYVLDETLLLDVVNMNNEEGSGYDKYTQTASAHYVLYMFDLADYLAGFAGDESYEISYDLYSEDSNITGLKSQIYANNNSNIEQYTGGLIIGNSKVTPHEVGKVNSFYEKKIANTISKEYRYVRINVSLDVADNTQPIEFYLRNVKLKVGGQSFIIPIGKKPLFASNYQMETNVGLPFVFANTESLNIINEKIDAIENTLELSSSDSRWMGKEYLSIGDSVTWYDGNTLNGTDGVVCVGYQQQIVKRLGVEYTNKGVSGMSMVKSPTFTSSFMNQMTTIDFSLYDIVTINLGTNDFWLNGGATIGELGNKTDTSFDETTFYGAYRKAVEYILRANPRVKLVLMTPTKLNATDPTPNGFTLAQYVKAIEDIGEMYGLPVVNLYKNSGFNKITFNTYTIDGVHPSNAGHYEMGNYTAGVLSTI